MNLEELQSRCYTPYSNSPDAVIVQSESGKFFPGIRIENISFPLSITALQCGMVICLSEGEEPKKLFLPEGYESTEKHLDYWTNEFSLEFVENGQIDGEASEILKTSDSINSSLQRLLDRSLTPYSQFPVSALLVTSNGFVTGVNIEFSAWDLGLCAERVALAKALAYGIDTAEINALHLHSRHGDFSSPCGACRQVIVEHLPRIPVCIHHPDGTLSRHFSSDLLPYSFKSDFLKKNNRQDTSE
ncbi:cytidine deaminase [Aliifodinibius sp. S!AR15-10]|uniref:cytidine deaminase n=1 Tax=Aliifodinibius sp. S!AR15-10 TaxID=2950437 RepID=UPI0028616C61|nr:cytidine deaminase [Aliifodinibius sp. S!AR15-10]MDR8390510.1 cytidine deaminase [Aliifodinibius sp. S!AR15-10]